MADLENAVPTTPPSGEPASPEAIIPEQSQAGEQPTTPDTQETKPEKVFTQKELDEIVAKRLAKAQRSFERQTRERLAAVAAPQAPKVAAQELSEPDPSQFTSYSEYLKALTKHEATKTAKAVREEAAAAERHQAEAARRAQLQSNFQRQAAEAAAKYPDFEDVAMAHDVPISPLMAEVIADSDHGAELAYYLGKHKDEAFAIANLHPLAAARELAKLEINVANKPPEITKAPPPVNPEGSKAKASVNPDDMTMEQWLAWRRKSLKTA